MIVSVLLPIAAYSYSSCAAQQDADARLCAAGVASVWQVCVCQVYVVGEV